MSILLSLFFISTLVRYKFVDTLFGKGIVPREHVLLAEDAFTLFMLFIWLDMHLDVELSDCYQFDEGLKKIYLPSKVGGGVDIVPFSFLNQLLTTFFMKNFIPINFIIVQEEIYALRNHVNSAEMTGCRDVLHKLFLGVPESEGVVYSRLSKRNFRFGGKFNGSVDVYPSCFRYMFCEVRKCWLRPLINSCRVTKIRLYQVPSFRGKFQDMSLVFNVNGLPQQETFKFSVCDKLEETLCYSEWIEVPNGVAMYGTGKRGRRYKNWEEDPSVSFSLNGVDQNYLMIEIECELVFQTNLNFIFTPGLEDGPLYLPLDNTRCVEGVKFPGNCFMKSVMKQRVDNHPGLKD